MDDLTAKDNLSANRSAEKFMIPKHRFDCVNLALKETKQSLNLKNAESETQKQLIDKLEKMLLDAKAETTLALNGVKNLAAAKALIDFSVLKLSLSGEVLGLNRQVQQIKQSDGYLFKPNFDDFILIPSKNKVIAIVDREIYSQIGEQRK